MQNSTKITLGGIGATAIAVVGIVGMEGGNPPPNSNAKNAVDRIIADKVVPAKELKGLLETVRAENGSELNRLKKSLQPLADIAKNNGKVKVLKLDKYLSLLSFGANISIVMENNEDFNQAIYRYLREQLEIGY